jgi:ribose transport system permease protein
MALVIVVGGIDLSVGSMFALTTSARCSASTCWTCRCRPVVVVTIAFGALLGAVNGFLIGYLRLRAFITTLITLIIYRSPTICCCSTIPTESRRHFPIFPSWNFNRRAAASWRTPAWCWSISSSPCSGTSSWGGDAGCGGLHITAIGGSRRYGYNSGIPVAAARSRCAMWRAAC